MQGHIRETPNLHMDSDACSSVPIICAPMYVYSPFLLGIVAVGLYAAVNFAQAILLSAKASMMARIMLTAAIYQKV